MDRNNRRPLLFREGACIHFRQCASGFPSKDLPDKAIHRTMLDLCLLQILQTLVDLDSKC